MALALMWCLSAGPVAQGGRRQDQSPHRRHVGVDIDPALVKKPAGKGLMNCFRPRGLHARAIAGRMPPRNGLALDMGVISGIMGDFAPRQARPMEQSEMKTEASRRTFVKTGIAAALATALLTSPPQTAAATRSSGLHCSTWARTCGLTCRSRPGGRFKPEDLHLVCQADHLRFDETVWRILTERMHKVGMNMVVIDLGEAIQYQSHPELAVKGSWPVEKFRKELARLRGDGAGTYPEAELLHHALHLAEGIPAAGLHADILPRLCRLVREVCGFSIRRVSSTWAMTRKPPDTRASTATWSCGKGNCGGTISCSSSRSRAAGRAAVDLVGLLLEPSRGIPQTDAQIGAAEQLVLRRDV